MGMYLYGSRGVSIEFNDHFDRFLLIIVIGIILVRWVMSKWRVEYFFDDFMRVSEHDLNLSLKDKLTTFYILTLINSYNLKFLIE